MEEPAKETVAAGVGTNGVLPERKKTWDYFEIDHPKAISDKKLQQLKAKYQRRKTDTAITAVRKSDSIAEEEPGEEDSSTGPTTANTITCARTPRRRCSRS